jgi:Radical SAM superfamily/Iron-sulfur cluster-binding domain
VAFSVSIAGAAAEVRIGQFSATVLPGHLAPLESDEDRCHLFKTSVHHVVIELSSACNRRCGFCPNAEGTRLKGQNYLADDLLDQILADLASIDYDRVIYWHLYNEPMQDMPRLTAALAKARHALPKATFAFNTNGDYLTPDTLTALAEAGCNKIFVSIYGPGQGQWDDTYISERVGKLARTLGLDNPVISKPGESHSVSGNQRGVQIDVVGRNLWKTGYNRGGLVDELAVKRTSPCLSPVTEFIIDHRGYVLPCCNVYTDRAEHLSFTAGKLPEHRNIFEAYASKAMTAWRKGTFQFNPGGPLCSECSRGEDPHSDTPANRMALEKTISSLLDAPDSIPRKRRLFDIEWISSLPWGRRPRS